MDTSMNNNPFFVRFGRYGNRVNSFASNIGGWFLIAPGVSLVLLGLAILIWPELLAYMIAGMMIVGGGSLALWGWRISQMQKQMRQRMQNGIYYEDEVRYGNNPYERY